MTLIGRIVEIMMVVVVIVTVATMAAALRIKSIGINEAVNTSCTCLTKSFK